MGCIDGEGRTVSFIQSVYFQYGSGVVIPETGMLWQNRGAGFTLQEGHVRQVRPGMKPYHTLNPAYARLKDGRTIAYGTMGGEGQPQTQAAMFTRYVDFGQSLQSAVSGPRWFLGKTTGGQTDSLKVESRFDPAVIDAGIVHAPEFADNETAQGTTGAMVVGTPRSSRASPDPTSRRG